MNAIEFVKQNGIDKVKQIVDLFPISTLINIDGVGVSVSDLKQIINAFKLVERYGGLEESSKLHYDEFRFDIHWSNLKQAIELVEKCK